MDKEMVVITRAKEGVKISISTDDLVFLAENNPDADYHILDKEKFMDAFIEQLKNFAESNATETGISEFQYLVDKCIHAVYESADESIADESEQA